MGGGQAAAGMERFKRQTVDLDASVKSFIETLSKGCCAGTIEG